MQGRTYRYMNDALFPFGYGLSYTTFDIGTAKPDKTKINPDESIRMTIPVTNTGERDGTEIVQVYVHKVNDIDGPIKTLKGFNRVSVTAGKTEQATIMLPPSSFEFYDWNTRRMKVTPGEYEVFYGTSSDSNDLKKLNITVL